MRKHRLLIIGVGSIGERHLRCAQRTERANIAICEVNDELRRNIADRYNISDAYSDFDSALAAGPTAAIICVPAQLHVNMALQLVDAGVHVLIEKPLSTSLDRTEELVHLAAKRQVIAAVAYVLRANPNLRAMHNALLSGRFGRPVQLVVVAGQNFPFYRPAYQSTYYREHRTGGGAIHDALTHSLNAAEWLVGPIDSVVAAAAHYLVPGVEVEDTVHVIARHQEVLSSFSLNQHQAPNEVTFTVICENGTLRCEFHENRFRWMSEPGGQWHDEPGPKHERDDLFVAQLLAFFGAIEKTETPLCSLDAGLQTLRVNLAIHQSVRSKQWTFTQSQSPVEIVAPHFAAKQKVQ